MSDERAERACSTCERLPRAIDATKLNAAAATDMDVLRSPA